MLRLGFDQLALYLGDVRLLVMAHFPFAIYYYVADESIRILSISHTSRFPGHWKKRR
jgi:hypothetical protein